jgi:hypothetical protein
MLELSIRWFKFCDILIRNLVITQFKVADKLNIIYSSSLLRRIRRDPNYQAFSIEFWVGHVITDGSNFYTYTERLQALAGEQSYQLRQPRLVKLKGNQQFDSERLLKKAIQKIEWAALRKHNLGYITVLELNQCLLSDLDREGFDSLLEETKEAAILLEDFEGYAPVAMQI